MAATTYKDFKGITNSNGDVFTNYQNEEALYVNGTLTAPATDGTITLASGGTYILTGRHYGRIIIGASTETELSADTFVYLNGVEIYANDANAYGIYYASKSQSMYVTLCKNRYNAIRCMYSQAMAEQQGACLYSENNMIVQGSGYLAVYNKGGHGIKASELRISGNPHIYAEAIHDAIHGNSNLIIDGGCFLVNEANDAFGTGSTGQIKIFGGKFRCYGISQNAIDSKVAGYYFCDALDLRTDAATATTGITKCDPSTYFGTASVKIGETEVTASEGVYTIDSGTEPEVTVTGYIEGTINVGVTKTKVILSNAYIKGSINYTLSSSNMQVESYNDTDNIIVGQINSNNNLQVEVKGGSHLVINSTENNALSGSEVTIHDQKGTLMVSTSASGKYGVQGTDIYISTSADYISGKNTDIKKEEVYGAIIADSIHARLTSGGKKSNITINSTLLHGCVYVDAISAETGSSSTTGVNLASSKNMFYHSLSGDTLLNDCGATSEPFDVVQHGIGAMPINF